MNSFKYMPHLYIGSKLKRLKGKLHILHSKLKEITEQDLDALRDEDKNIYQLLLEWLIDVVSYGAAVTFIYSVFLGWQGVFKSVKLALGFGIMLWAWIHFLKESRRAIKEE